jgi:methionine-S-sulfoxide reductase
MKGSALLIALPVFLLVAWIAYGYFAIASIEVLPYSVLDSSKEYEVRRVDAHIVAEVTVGGDYQEASNNGFRKVADYIFGNNVSKEKVAMTTPVVETPSEKVAMTTPVVNSEPENGERVIGFVMPAEYNIDTLPIPNNDEVRIREVPAQTLAVLRFSWFATEARFEKKKAQLTQALERDGIEFQEIQTARYNPPVTPPFMLRNEVWATITMQTTQEKIAELPENAKLATFAGGCFWCVESTFDNMPGVYDAVSGYIGGTEQDADYYKVASGRTEHREAIQVYYNPDEVTYEALLKLFWQQIDPTDEGGQFVDRGFQYTTAIYTRTDEERSLAEASKKEVEEGGIYTAPIVTEILPFEDDFYFAEEEHQDYAKKRPAYYERYKNGSGR